MKKLLLLIIAVLLITGCNNDVEEVEEPEKIVFEDTLYCNSEKDDLSDCIAFYKNTIVVGNFKYYEKDKNEVEPLNTYPYKMDGKKFITDASIKYLEDSKMLNYEGTKYKQNKDDYKKVKRYLDKLYEISGNTSKSEYMYCSSSLVNAKRYKYSCYSFNFDKTIDYAKVTIDNEIVYGINDEGYGKIESGVYTLVEDEAQIFKYNKLNNTYKIENFELYEDYIFTQGVKYKKCTDILNCDV